MTLTPTVRKLGLTAHVVLSIGWLGAVVVFLVLSLVGLTTPDAELSRAAHMAMNEITRLAIVPMAAGSLLTGVLVSLTTAWGLFRHYWVVAKLCITLIVTALLWFHMGPIELLATLAREEVAPNAEAAALESRLLLDAALALLALLANALLSIFKPWGLTPHGKKLRQLQAASSPVPARRRTVATPSAAPKRLDWAVIAGIHAVGLAVLLVIVHLAGIAPH